MNNCIAVVSDLIFATRIAATADKLGARCRVVRDLASLHHSMVADAPEMVLVDMHCDGIAPDTVIRSVKSVCPHVTVVAFYSHVQTHFKAMADDAGADKVLPRSAFVRRLPDLFAAPDTPLPQ